MAAVLPRLDLVSSLKLNMALVLYQGKAIAFGPSAEVFARVNAVTERATVAQRSKKTSNLQEIRQAPAVESVEP